MRQVPLVIEPDLDDGDGAIVQVDGTVAGRPYRFVLDTGAARTQLVADEYTAALPAMPGESSLSALGGCARDPVVVVAGLAVGPLRVAQLAVTRVAGGSPGHRNLLGMDVLGRYCCHFRLDAAVLELGGPPGRRAGQDLLMSSRGHAYVELHWPGVTALACWDTGASATIVNHDFWARHPGLFEEAGSCVGADASGAQASTPVLTMAGPVIGGRPFAAHRVVAVDMSRMNATAEYPRDLILGYPTIRQAGWLLDFPARRWALTD